MANETSPPPANYLDDLFDYDAGLDEILSDIPNQSKDNDNAQKSTAPPDNSGLVLGLDEEVKVAKKRQPVAKLDEGRLLSQAGIPKLRYTAKRKLKFKGKGHEFSDMARLLNFYQLWLDDLFPRAKFADGLTIIEKLGHSKRLQTMRREWIDEEKPSIADSPLNDLPTEPGNQQMLVNGSNMAENIEPPPALGSAARLEVTQGRDEFDQELFMPVDKNEDAGPQVHPDDDELDALLREQEDMEGLGSNVTIPTATNIIHGIGMEADDL